MVIMDENLKHLLVMLVEKNGSDLHLTAGSPPMIRVDGMLRALQEAKELSPKECERLCLSFFNDNQKKELLENKELDLSFGIEGLGRFRVNLFLQRGSMAASIRMIPFEPWPLSVLGLPKAIEGIILKQQGFVLVTGPAGSGKSTTLAAMIDFINKCKSCHIITIEDPIEFLHKHKMSIVNQREIGTDANSFTRALKSVLREDPDVVLIGEMRDLESIEAALHIAETGHMVFSTLHTNSTVQTINRIIDVFPSQQQAQVRTQLSFVLDAVISQRLLPKVGGGRVMAYEFMMITPAIKNLIREGKTHQIYSQMQVGQEKTHMVTMNQSLTTLFLKGEIKEESAMFTSNDVDDLKRITGLHNKRNSEAYLLTTKKQR